jgi:PAS domain S-box-containing protein
VNPEPFFIEPPFGALTEKSAQQPLHREELFKLLVSSVKDYAIFMLDPNGVIITWNEGAQRAKGYTAEEIIGKHFSIFYTAESRASNHPQHELEIATETGRYEEEGWRIRKDGTMFWANVVITALRSGGELIGFAKVTRDLTDKKILEQQREEQQKLLTETNEELQRLAYVVSHELQAPIATISRYCNLLSVRYHDKLGDDANDFLAKMTTSSQMIGRMVDDLWTYARISKPGSSMESVPLTSAANDAIAELKDMLADNEVTLGTLPTVRGNRRQLIYLFRELIVNAIRYRSEQAPRIEISSHRVEDGVVISVKDNGAGIDEVFRLDVFRLFHRLKGGPDPDATGMGLSICKKIVQQHRGRIWFESKVGEGTTFHIWLPKSAES